MKRLLRDMGALADDLEALGLTQTAEKLFELALQVATDRQPATIREIRANMLMWQRDLETASPGPIILNDLDGVLGQLRELQHDLEG